jgi:protein-S-isoprenylcysteine O-methyltransferase Ste14
MPLWVRAALMTLLFPGVVAGVVPYRLARGPWAALFPLGMAQWLGLPVLLVGAGVLIATICAFAFSGRGTLAPWDAPTSLVVSGLYRWVRNPMYLGVLGVIVGQGLLWSSLGVLGYGIAVALAFHVRVVRFEEPALRGQFGAAFTDYVALVPRWLPRQPRTGID